MTSRIDHLARPKPNLLRFPDRPSVYWLDELQLKSKNRQAAVFEMTPRLKQLAQFKQLNSFFEDSSRPPEWMISPAALKARPSPRVCVLALPRATADGWQPERPLLTTVSDAVKTVKASRRICELAQPKQLKMSHVSADTSICLSNFATRPSSRLCQLASPKLLHPQYVLPRPVASAVPAHVLKAVASERLEVLARPKTCQALFEGYKPSSVSPAARTTTASSRLLELSVPLPRKCKT